MFENYSEEDTKRLFITPELEKKWSVSLIEMEHTITDGRINLKENLVFREKGKKADYVLYHNRATPLAIVEAKKYIKNVSDGMQQAKEYAQMMNIPFAYSSNGKAFQEYDFITGLEKEITIDAFPTQDELFKRYKSEKRLTESELQLIEQSNYASQNLYPPRYYQQNAINKTLEAIAKNENRILLVMATGTGKTYTAFQIVWRLLRSKRVRKVLYLADRNILVDQSIEQDFKPLSNTIHKINFKKDNRSQLSSYEVYFSLYQQLAGNGDVDDTADCDEEEENTEVMERFKRLFDPDYFDLVIVDECHRGSAKKDSNWRRVLEYFSPAIQIGMTATPRETKDVSNIDYFNEPVFTYSLKEGIEDGFLAPYRVIDVKTNIGEGWRPYKGQCDKNGQPIEDRIYTNSDFDYNIVLEARDLEVAGEITKYLKKTDRYQKTIVFCATEDHAERMRAALTYLNADMMRENPDYVVRITGSDAYGKSKLSYFISVSAKYPVIATTSKLLSTGADCKMTKLIVLDQMISSMTDFKQIIGRGTRLRENDGKTHFVVMDFRHVTRLFADPAWDGPIEQDEGYNPDVQGPPPSPPSPPPDPKNKPIVDANGCPVKIIGKTVSVYDADGKLLRQEDIVDYTKSNIVGKYASLENFIRKWTKEDKKAAIAEALKETAGIDLEALKKQRNMSDVDDFDFICHVAFDQKPLTRKERANNVKKRDFLNKYKNEARAVLEALLDKYMNFGVYEIESAEILRLDPFLKYGKPSKIAQMFGGKDGYFQAVHELENELYKVVNE